MIAQPLGFMINLEQLLECKKCKNPPVPTIKPIPYNSLSSMGNTISTQTIANELGISINQVYDFKL